MAISKWKKHFGNTTPAFIRGEGGSLLNSSSVHLRRRAANLVQSASRFQETRDCCRLAFKLWILMHWMLMYRGNSCVGSTVYVCVCGFFFLSFVAGQVSRLRHINSNSNLFSFSSSSPVAGKQHKSLRVCAQETKYIQSARPLCIDSHIINSGSLRAQTVVWLNSAGSRYWAEIAVL